MALALTFGAIGALLILGLVALAVVIFFARDLRETEQRAQCGKGRKARVRKTRRTTLRLLSFEGLSFVSGCFIRHFKRNTRNLLCYLAIFLSIKYFQRVLLKENR